MHWEEGWRNVPPALRRVTCRGRTPACRREAWGSGRALARPAPSLFLVPCPHTVRPSCRTLCIARSYIYACRLFMVSAPFPACILRACLALERYGVAACARWHEHDVAERPLCRLAARAKVALSTNSVRLDMPTIPPGGCLYRAIRE